MSKSNTIKALALFAVASMILAACGGGGAEPAATEPAAEGPKVTSSGFECPETNPRMEVTSKELNMFVSTEYFPQDMLDCFELVYDIKLNRDEYSSNEGARAPAAPRYPASSDIIRHKRRPHKWWYTSAAERLLLSRHPSPPVVPRGEGFRHLVSAGADREPG